MRDSYDDSPRGSYRLWIAHNSDFKIGDVVATSDASRCIVQIHYSLVKYTGMTILANAVCQEAIFIQTQF